MPSGSAPGSQGPSDANPNPCSHFNEESFGWSEWKDLLGWNVFFSSQATSDGCVGQEVIFDGAARASRCGAKGTRQWARDGLPGPAAPHQLRPARSAPGGRAVLHHPLRLLLARAGECCPMGHLQEGWVQEKPALPGEGGQGPELPRSPMSPTTQTQPG